MEQRARTATLDAFRRGDITYLAASDVAARGLDIPDVSHIFNFDVPISPEDYVHRVGRTGRAGREGFAAMIVTPSDIEGVRAIEKLCREKIEWIDGEPSADLLQSGHSNRRRRPRGRGRDQGEARAEKPARSGHPRARSNGERGSPSEQRSTGAEQRAAASERRSTSGEGRTPAQPKDKVRKPRDHAAERDERSKPAAASVVTPWPGREEHRARPAAQHPPRERSRGMRQPVEELVVGLGDLVPAFLMNPVRRAK